MSTAAPTSKRVLSSEVAVVNGATSPGAALEMLRLTGCDAAMIGRGSMTNPWIFRQTADLLAGRAPMQPTLADRRALILRHFGMMRAEEEPRNALHKFRTFTGWYTHGLKDGRSLRQRIQGIDSVDGFFDEFERFFSHLETAEREPAVAG